MKTKYLKGIMALGLAVTLLFSSCLKDARQFQPESVQSNLAELPLSGLAHFAADAVTAPGLDTVIFAVGVTAANPPSTSTSVTLAVDNSLINTYNAANPAITYLPVPTAAYKLVSTTVVIPSGKNSTLTSVIIDRDQLDPAGSYMLPVKIASASGLPISANYSVHYYHIIGNDFAGAYIYDYRRYNNGTGPGAGIIPSQVPTATDPGTTLNQNVQISPVSPTEFKMTTGYNGQGVQYDVTFTRTASGGKVTYTNWKVTFPASELLKWSTAASPISNFVPPAFTIPPPADNTSPKIFELNYISGGAAGRYIDDTYHK